MRKAVLALALALSAVVTAALVYRSWQTLNVGRVQRGARLADEKGCFSCHGPGGLRGMANPGHGLEEVPPFSGGLITMYAESEGEIREWILDGLPQRIRGDPQQMKLREGALILMPAFREVLSDGEVDDLVAFVKAASDFESPPEGPASEGRAVAARLGCFNCHGPQGRGSAPNPGALKGYIPAWDGDDFPELVRDEAELREWILDGRPRRLSSHPVARHFLERQSIQMPGYRGRLSEAELAQLVAYVGWVRAHRY